MRVLFISQTACIGGGVERWMADMIAGLKADDIQCTVGLAKGLVFHKPKNYLAAYPEIDGFIELDGTSGVASSRRLAVARAIYSLQPQIVVPVMCADGLAESVRLKSKLNFRIVYPVHEICDGVANDLQRFAPWIDQVIFVDQGGLQRYQSLLDSIPVKAGVIPCGVLGSTTEHKESDPKALHIGFCGRLQQNQKRALDLVHLCEQLEEINQPYHLHIIGDGPERVDLSAKLATRIGSGVVEMSPRKNRDEIFKTFYPAIDVLFVASDWETGPLVAFEAMMNHCLVVTSNFSGRETSRSLMDGERCLVFPVGDMAAAARRLQWVATHRDDARMIAHRGFQYAMDNRSIDQMVTSWVNVFNTAWAAAPVVSNAPVPKEKTGQSRLEALGCPDWLSARLRKCSGRRFEHAHAGEEWPYYSGPVHE